MKTNPNKKRAPQNRTINLNGKEIPYLQKELLILNEKSSYRKVKNKIINQPLEEAVKYLPAGFADLLFIDPPYNINKKFNKLNFKEMDFLDYENWFESWFVKLLSLLKNNASVYVCGDWKTSHTILKIGMKYLKVRNRITWEREKGRGSKKNWKNCSEDIWFFTKSNDFTFNIDDVKLRRKVLAPYKDKNGKAKDWKRKGEFNFRDTFPSNIWTDISIPFWSMPENTDHPTQKPEKLLAKIILASSNKGDTVFDPFAGSGTTAVVAKKLQRNFIAIEMDEYYSLLAQKRLNLADSDKEIQGYADGVFWERNTLQDQMKKKK